MLPQFLDLPVAAVASCIRSFDASLAAYICAIVAGDNSGERSSCRMTNRSCSPPYELSLRAFAVFARREFSSATLVSHTQRQPVHGESLISRLSCLPNRSRFPPCQRLYDGLGTRISLKLWRLRNMIWCWWRDHYRYVPMPPPHKTDRASDIVHSTSCYEWMNEWHICITQAIALKTEAT